VTRTQTLSTIGFVLLIGAIIVALVVRLPQSGSAARRDSRSLAPTATATPLLTPTNRLSVALSGPGTPAYLTLSTNEETWEDLGEPTNARGQAVANALYSWNPPDVRLHFGFRADVPALPEATRGTWDFSHMDAAISALRAHGTSFFLNVRTAPLWMYDHNGQLPDSMFPVYAQYLARIVGWYNQGGFTDDNGTFHSSGHMNWVHTWEVWNEPKSGAEIPAPLPSTYAPPWMTAERFAALYDRCSAAMRAVDPTRVSGGPALGSWALRHVSARLHGECARARRLLLVPLLCRWLGHRDGCR
jgi:hypothetical protein